jgi:hypothetical protein
VPEHSGPSIGLSAWRGLEFFSTTSVFSTVGVKRFEIEISTIMNGETLGIRAEQFVAFLLYCKGKCEVIPGHN